MKKKLFLFSVVVSLLLVLSGCGGNKTKEGINEISLKQLEKKLDNNETFFLLTVESNETVLEESRFLGYYDDALKKSGIRAYFVNLMGESKENIDNLSNNHLHPFMSNYGDGNKGWDSKGEGLVYVENGGVLNLVRATPFHESYIEKGISESRVNENINDLLRLLKEQGFNYE